MKIIRVEYCDESCCPYHFSIMAGRHVICEKIGKDVYNMTLEERRGLLVDGKLPIPSVCPLEDEQ